MTHCREPVTALGFRQPIVDFQGLVGCDRLTVLAAQ